MFEYEITDLDAATTLAASAREQARENHAATQRLLLAAHYADLHPSPATLPSDQRAPGTERDIRYGGPGCPGVAEFAVAEYGAVHGVSTESAAKFIGQALALRHRLPHTWQRLTAHEITPWKARHIATACIELTLEAAALVDTRVAPIVDTVGPIQLRNIIKAAIWDADPETAKATAEQKAREHGVWVSRSDDHGTSTVYIKARTGDVIRFNATINQIADALTTLNGPLPPNLQRARAFGVLTDPALTHHLLQVAQHLATTHEPATTEPAATEQTLHKPATAESPAHEPAADTTPLHEPATAAPAADEPRLHESRTDELPANEPPADEFPADEPLTHAPAAATPPPHEPQTDQLPANEPPADSLATKADLLLNDTTPHSPPNPSIAEEIVADLDASARQGLTTKLSTIKAFSDRNSSTRPTRTKLYIHLTDETLLAGTGCMRVENFGPVYTKLAELVGHDRITIQPVIDLHDQINENAYEIPTRLRERIKLTYPVEQFPYGPAETTNHTDIDHLTPYNPTGPNGQTSTTNLRPLRRRSHRIKTFAGWTTKPINNTALEWTTPHGYKFRVDHTGTHPIPHDNP